MGCGCKGDSPKGFSETEKVDLNIKGKILKMPIAILTTLLIVVISPLLLVFVWYLAMKSVFGKEANLVDLMLSNFVKKKIKNEDVSDSFDEEDYELTNVEIINR